MIETKGERAEDDEGPSPKNNRDDDENRREGLATLLRLREKRGNAERERGENLSDSVQ